MWLSGPLPKLLSLHVSYSARGNVLSFGTMDALYYSGGINWICLRLMLITLSSVSCSTESLQLTVLISSTAIAATGGISILHIHNSVKLYTFLWFYRAHHPLQFSQYMNGILYLHLHLDINHNRNTTSEKQDSQNQT